MRLRYIAQARCGDKGDTADITLFAPTERLYEVFRRQIPPERVLAHFRGIAAGPVRRYEVPNLLALKYVLHGALGGGAAASLRTDNLGKSLAGALLRMTVDVDERDLDGVRLLRCPEEQRLFTGLAKGWVGAHMTVFPERDDR